MNYRFRETEIPIGRLLVNLSTTKTAKSQRSAIFTAAFCSTWRTDKVRELHSTVPNSLQGSRLLLWNLDYILGQNMSSFRTIVFLVREDERTISVSLPGLEYCEASGPFLLSFSLSFRNSPFSSGFSGFIAPPLLQYLTDNWRTMRSFLKTVFYMKRSSQ